MLSFFPRFNLNRPGPGEWWRTLESEINSLNEIRFLSGSFIRGIFMGIKRSFYTKFGVCCVGTGGDRGGGRDSIKLKAKSVLHNELESRSGVSKIQASLQISK